MDRKPRVLQACHSPREELLFLSETAAQEKPPCAKMFPCLTGSSRKCARWEGSPQRSTARQPPSLDAAALAAADTTAGAGGEACGQHLRPRGDAHPGGGAVGSGACAAGQVPLPEGPHCGERTLCSQSTRVAANPHAAFPRDERTSKGSLDFRFLGEFSSDCADKGCLRARNKDFSLHSGANKSLCALSLAEAAAADSRTACD